MVRKRLPRGEMAKRIRLMMAATGLSDEGCRKHLLAGTVPKSPLIAAAWRQALRSVA
jgi:hypothetical protein